MPWISVLEEQKLKENSRVLVSPRGVGILLFRKTGIEIFAVRNKCPHMACPLRSGALDGYVLQCPCHDWRFDIRTGEMAGAHRIRVSTYPVRVAEGMISINLEES